MRKERATRLIPFTRIPVRNRKGSTRHGGSNSHGKGSHYHGGH
ncbi:hypothetical protein [Gordonia sp. (in: high G+C Gram-positive bacteria)]